MHRRHHISPYPAPDKLNPPPISHLSTHARNTFQVCAQTIRLLLLSDHEGYSYPRVILGRGLRTRQPLHTVMFWPFYHIQIWVVCDAVVFTIFAPLRVGVDTLHLVCMRVKT